jgi:FkbM family methyltransferase
MSIAAETAFLNLTVPARAEPVPFLYFPASRQHILGILEGRTYPPLPDVGPVATIVDIGANVGAASVMFATRHPGAAVHAFEPGPGPLELLRQNAAHFPSITVHSFGLGIEDTEQRLYRSSWDPMSASVLPSAENTGLFDVIPVRRTRAALGSTGITSIDVLKIDTEGCEVPILCELEALLPSVKCVYLEFHSDRDRLRLDERLARTHVLAHAAVRHPHRGDVCYVHRETVYARRHALLAIEHGR